MFSEPPLNEEDVPLGEWLCPRCRALQDIRCLKDRSSFNKISPNSPRPKDLQEKPIRLSINGISKQNYSISIVEESSFDFRIKLLDLLNRRKNPMAELIKVALILNPKEFELSDSCIPEIQFPGSSKKQVTNATRESRVATYCVKRAQELETTDSPLILRTCYSCRKGCREAPLIHCDYCPLLYHADCVDPPLINLPNTRWMCPNHVEPIAEDRLLSSSSYSERVKLWSYFARPIDQESIKIDFLDKVHEQSTLDSHNDQCSLNTSLMCIVPKRIKKEYKKFIIENNEYHEKNLSSSESASSLSTSDCDQLLSPQKHESREYLPNGQKHPFYQLIESSKILELIDRSGIRKTIS